MARDNATKGTSLAPVGGRSALREVEAHSSVALLEFQSPTASLIAEPVPLSARYTSLILASLVVVSVLLLAYFKVDRVVVTTGQVATTSSDVVVQPLETSIVRSIRVRTGDTVKKGQLLAELDPTFARGDDRSTTAQAASLRAEVDRLRAELAGRTYESDGTPYSDMQAAMFAQRKEEHDSHVASLRAKVDSVAVKVEQAAGDIANARSRLVGLRDVEARREELERLKVGAHLNTLAARDARLQMEAQLADAVTTRDGSLRDLQAAQADLADYEHQWRSDTSLQLSQQERLLSDMQGQATKAQLRYKLVELRAPEDGVVLSVAKVSTGSVLQSGDEFIRLVPIDAPLEVDVLVPGNTAGFIHLGDPVTIKFDTFPYIEYGYAIGKVDVVSADSFPTPPPPRFSLPTQPDTQSSAPNNMPSGSAVFTARISISELRMRNVPASFRLTPGMPVTADVKVGKHSILAAMFSRLGPIATEGLRDP
jgi:HlyD family secretion protein